MKKAFNCRKCQQPSRVTGWCFYELCEACFREFDAQKMAGRFGKTETYYDHVDAWIADDPTLEPAGA